MDSLVTFSCKNQDDLDVNGHLHSITLHDQFNCHSMSMSLSNLSKFRLATCRGWPHLGQLLLERLKSPRGVSFSGMHLLTRSIIVTILSLTASYLALMIQFANPVSCVCKGSNNATLDWNLIKVLNRQYMHGCISIKKLLYVCQIDYFRLQVMWPMYLWNGCLCNVTTSVFV